MQKFQVLILWKRDHLLVQVCNSAHPRAPWDEGLCKVCGRDKDGDNVLLCDKCDSEYHRYCLDPLLLRIPERNWYCPSYISGQSLPCIRTYGSISNQHNRWQTALSRKAIFRLALCFFIWWVSCIVFPFSELFSSKPLASPFAYASSPDCNFSITSMISRFT